MPQDATTVVTSAARRRNRLDRRFYISAGLFVILVSLAGFVPSIADQSRRNAPITPLVIAHGVVAAGWLVLFLLQSTLVAMGRTDVHRRVGRIGPVLAAGMLALGVLMLVATGRRGFELSGDLTRALNPPGAPRLSAAESAPGVLFPLAGFLSFGTLVAAALLYRRRPETHKRLMLFAMFPLVSEPVVHLIGYLAGHWRTLQGAAPMFALPVQLVLLSVSAIHDKVSRGRIHLVSWLVPVLLIIWLGLLPAVAQAAVWRELALWFVR